MSYQSTIMLRAARTALFLTLITFLAGCSRDSREADIKKCVAETQRQLAQGQLAHGAPANESAEEKHDRIGGMITACMEKLGYRHDQGSMANAHCVDDVDYNPCCYARGR